MTTFLLALLFLGAEDKRPAVSPRPSPPEFGFGLSQQDALSGWISLFDGTTTFGWDGATAKYGRLSGGKTTFVVQGPFRLRAVVKSAGKLDVGGRSVDLATGNVEITLDGSTRGPLGLGEGLQLEQIAMQPLELSAVFNGKDLSGWNFIRHPRRPAKQQTKWSIEDGRIRGVGGSGAVELDRLLGNFVLQIDVRTRRPLANGGVFVRSIPGDFMNGYEAQVFNACYDGDPAKPAVWSTGAIDDRQMARRVVSRDEKTFTMTVMAQGPHIATWVNGYQMTDWVDTRPLHDNPRRGKRLKPGTLQLQSHDPMSDVEFSNIRVREFASQ